MPTRAAPPKGGDLPAFPSAAQYSGTTEVFTSQRRNAPSPAPTRGNTGGVSPYPSRQKSAGIVGDPRNGPQVGSARRPPDQIATRPVGTTRIPSHHSNPISQPRPRDDRQRDYPIVDQMRQVSIGTNNSNTSAPSRRPVMGVQSSGRPRSPYAPPNSNIVGQPFGVIPPDANGRPNDYDPVLWNIFRQVCYHDQE